MQVAVLGASGRAGSEITKELAARGHRVTAIARHPDRIPAAEGITRVAGDAHDAAALATLLHGHDAVISALHFDVALFWLPFDGDRCVCRIAGAWI